MRSRPVPSGRPRSEITKSKGMSLGGCGKGGGDAAGGDDLWPGAGEQAAEHGQGRLVIFHDEQAKRGLRGRRSFAGSDLRAGGRIPTGRWPARGRPAVRR